MTDDVDVVLRERARDWEAHEPSPPSLDQAVIRATLRRSHRTGWTIAASVVAVLAATLTALVVATRPAGSPATAPTTTAPTTSVPARYRLTPEQRELALRIAHREALGLNPADPSRILPRRMTYWPAYVRSVSARAVRPAISSSNGPFRGSRVMTRIVVRLVGHFAAVTPGPKGHGPITGNVVTAVAFAGSGAVSDFGIQTLHPPHDLTYGTILFRR